MPHPHSSALLLLIAATGCLAATAADAQSSGRYLTWSNRPASTTPGEVRAATARLPENFIPRRVAPSQGGPRPEMQAPALSMIASQGLTPANAWMGPRVNPAHASNVPNPMAYAAAGMTGATTNPAVVNPYAASMVPYGAAAPYSPAPAPAPAPTPIATPAPMPDPAPIRHEPTTYNTPGPAPSMPVPHSVPVETSSAPVPASGAPAADPMAPRRDARIFQVQDPAQGGQPAAATPAQSQNGPRYYSVHREAGRTPDPTTIPEPVYFDSVSMDLAQPPEVELPLRDAQGRGRVVANADPSLP